MKKVIYIKYGWNTIVWTKIMHLGHKVQNLLGVQIHTTAKSQNFVDISVAQRPTWAKFLEFGFFLSEKTRLYICYLNKNQLGVTSSSYINLTMKLLIKSKNSQKSRAQMKFTFFGKPYLSFALCRLLIFSGFIVLQGMMQIN